MVMDTVIASLLNEFRKKYNFVELSESKAFEHLVNYCIVSRISSERFNIEDVGIGGGGDGGIDGIAIVVNGILVRTKEEVDDLREKLGVLDVKFIFIQSKTSRNFDSGDIGKFIDGVRNYFNRNPSGAIGLELQALIELKEYIYSWSIDMIKNPALFMYYATTGQWNSDRNLQSRIDRGISDLRSENLFDRDESSVKFIAVDSQYLQGLYREIRNKVRRQIDFERHVVLPKIDGVQEAYLGILPCAEYLKLICTEDGTLQKSLFYDNVRDFQGENSVNSGIEETIKSSQRNDSFVLLNNGITVVAKTLNRTGSTFTISDYQVVNGCQTSHILHKNRNFLNETVNISVKLIVTGDEEITNKIITATNRQTEVKEEAFWSLTPFNRKLEVFYSSFDDEYKLYYERRSKQYDIVNIVVDNYKVISPSLQVTCFLGMFLDEPHETHGYYGKILEKNKERIFVESHSLYPYYLSAYACFSLEKFRRIGDLEHSFVKSYRYHMLMIFKYLTLSSEGFNSSISSNPLDLSDSRKTESIFRQFQDVIHDESKALKLFQDSQSLLEQAIEAKRGDYRSQLNRLSGFTDYILYDLLSKTPRVRTRGNLDRDADPGIKVGKEYKSTIAKLCEGFGFIAYRAPEINNLFFHWTYLANGVDFASLNEGMEVMFTAEENNDTRKGKFVAKNVRLNV
jgi:hypothetical protein